MINLQQDVLRWLLIYDLVQNQGSWQIISSGKTIKKILKQDWLLSAWFVH